LIVADTITVYSLLHYLTEVEGFTWRNQDYTANKIVHVVKGDPIKGYFEVVVVEGKLRVRRRFDQRNGEEFIPILTGTLATRLSDVVDGNFAIVPIPNSDATIAKRDQFRTLDHAIRIASTIGSRAVVVPALRWKEEKISARKGGSRDPQVHYENLRVVEKPDRPVIIFDDVMTTGSQMIAASRRLQKAGAHLLCGVVVGRATKEQREKM
jgi:hypothetical protein